jgi:hypothetical protein
VHAQFRQQMLARFRTVFALMRRPLTRKIM